MGMGLARGEGKRGSSFTIHLTGRQVCASSDVVFVEDKDLVVNQSDTLVLL